MASLVVAIGLKDVQTKIQLESEDSKSPVIVKKIVADPLTFQGILIAEKASFVECCLSELLT
jgi:hypothetical protein